jgi:tetratricopeptide (TPR) repeat protein
VGGFAFLLALFPLRSFDVWWHMANGREVVEGRGIPRENRFSFTHPDHEVVPTHWLFGVGAYLVGALGGPTGLVLAKAVVLAAAFVICYRTGRRRGAGEVASAVVLAVAVLASRRRFLERPHLFTMLGLAVFAYLLQRFREEGSGPKRKRLLALAFPAISCLWANLHAGCLFGVGLLFLEAAGEFASWARLRMRGAPASAGAEKGRDALLLAAAAAASALAVMLTPAGAAVYPYNLWHVGLDEVVPLVEFRWTAPWDYPFFYLLLVGCAATLVLDRAGSRPGEWLVLLAFGAVAVWAVRGVPNFCVLAAPVIAPRLPLLWRYLGRRKTFARAAGALEGVPGAAFGAALLLFPLVASALSARYAIGIGLERDFFPAGAARFVEREIESPRVFNDLATGGYLVWEWYPERRVFIDGRTNAYPPEHFRLLYTRDDARLREEFILEKAFAVDPDERSAEGLRAMYRGVVRDDVGRRLGTALETHDVNAALLYFYYGYNPFWPAFDPAEWAVVYAEEPALVLMRRIAPNRATIERLEGRLGARGEEALSRRFASRGDECVAEAAEAAARALAYEEAAGREVFEPRERAGLHLRRGHGERLARRPGAAAAAYREALRLRPGWITARANLAHALLELGRPAEARRVFDAVLAERPRMPEALFGLAECLDELGDGEGAQARYREFLDTRLGRPEDARKARERVEGLRR